MPVEGRESLSSRSVREVLALRFLNNRDRRRLFRLRVKASDTAEVVVLEGIPSTNDVADRHLRLAVPGIATFRLEWKHILSLEEIRPEITGRLQERTTEPDLPFASAWKSDLASP